MVRMIVMAGWIGCTGGTESPSPTGDTSTGSTDPATVSLVDDVVPIVERECGVCHTRTDSPSRNAVRNDVFLERRNDLLRLVGTAVVAGDAAGSDLIAWMTQAQGAGSGPTLMPPPGTGDPMDAADIAVVETWIDEGAPDN